MSRLAVIKFFASVTVSPKSFIIKTELSLCILN
jgi:hypothetical protein